MDDLSVENLASGMVVMMAAYWAAKSVVSMVWLMAD